MNSTKNNNHDEMIPLKFHLSQNYPNPFNETTIIKYCVAYRTKVRITIFNSEGEMIEKILDEEKNAGTYEIEFNACQCQSGRKRALTGGTYIYELNAGDYTNTKKMIVLYSNN